MSSPLDKREKAEEAKFALDEDKAFKVNARRNKLLGLWVADILGLKEEDADAYARQTVLADFEEPGQEDVLRKVLKDIKNSKEKISEEQIRSKMNELHSVAREQIDNE